jgi:hypothetical protein
MATGSGAYGPAATCCRQQRFERLPQCLRQHATELPAHAMHRVRIDHFHLIAQPVSDGSASASAAKAGSFQRTRVTQANASMNRLRHLGNFTAGPEPARHRRA